MMPRGGRGQDSCYPLSDKMYSSEGRQITPGDQRSGRGGGESVWAGIDNAASVIWDLFR